MYRSRVPRALHKINVVGFKHDRLGSVDFHAKQTMAPRALEKNHRVHARVHVRCVATLGYLAYYHVSQRLATTFGPKSLPRVSNVCSIIFTTITRRDSPTEKNTGFHRTTSPQTKHMKQKKHGELCPLNRYGEWFSGGRQGKTPDNPQHLVYHSKEASATSSMLGMQHSMTRCHIEEMHVSPKNGRKRSEAKNHYTPVETTWRAPSCTSPKQLKGIFRGGMVEA